LKVGREVVYRLDGHDNIHLALVDLIDGLPRLLHDTRPDDEIVLSIYVWPDDFENDSGFSLDVAYAERLAESRCALNVVFMADNAGPLP
jgi:hypothetical protein